MVIMILGCGLILGLEDISVHFISDMMLFHIVNINIEIGYCFYNYFTQPFYSLPIPVLETFTNFDIVYAYLFTLPYFTCGSICSSCCDPSSVYNNYLNEIAAAVNSSSTHIRSLKSM